MSTPADNNIEASLYTSKQARDNARKVSHTPGPWGIFETKTKVFIKQGEYPIAEVLANQGANARLIASAPELLEACKEAAIRERRKGLHSDVAFVQRLEQVTAKAELTK